MVKMASRLTFGPVPTETQEGINIPRMRQERAARAKQIMKQQGIPTMLVTIVGNVRYLTSFVWGEWQPALSYALFFAEHDDPVIFAHAGSYQQMPDQAPWIKHWRIGRAWLGAACGAEAAQEEAQLFAQEIRQELQERGLAGEKLGIVGFDKLAEESLSKARIKVVDAGPLLMEASKIKTQDEINCIKMACSISSSGFQRVREVLRPGMTEVELGRKAMDAVLDAGGEMPGVRPKSGPLSFERGFGPVRRIEYGDLVYVPLCTIKYMGYNGCQYRQYIVGRKPTDKEKDWYKKLKDRLDACIDASRVGNTTADAAKFFPPASTWGYKDEAEVLTVEMGHGVGIVNLAPTASAYNPPVINRQWSLKHPQPFEEGMVIAYESLEGEHRVGGVRLENCIVITKNGPEILDWFPRDEILVV